MAPGASADSVASRGIESLLNFLGYGNPAGRFWFIGIEETTGAKHPNAEKYRKEHETKLQFEEVEDLRRAEDRLRNAIGKPPSDRRKINQTWNTMSRLILRINRGNWFDTEAVKDYQSSELGRDGGDSFLAELFPLRKAGDQDWPACWPFDLWPGPDEYRNDVLPARLKRLRSRFDEHHPQFVFWYGWNHSKRFKDILFPEFRDQQLRPIADGAARVGSVGSSKIVFTPFFGFRFMPKRLIDAIATDLGE